jgi:iron complex transport system permease protein
VTERATPGLPPGDAPARRRRAARVQFALLIASALLATTVGAVTVQWTDFPAAAGLLLGEPAASATHGASSAAVLAWVRLPRVLLAGAVGATLGLCGAAMQGLFRNPLADPALLGISSGAAMGVVTVTVLADALWPAAATALGRWLVPGAAFVGALASVVAVHRLSLFGGRTAVGTIMLAGIGVNALAGAVTGFLLAIADDAQLRTVTFWSLGSLAGASWSMLAVSLPLLAISAAVLPRLAIDLDAVNLGEAEALHIGVNVDTVTRMLLVAVSLGVAASVSVAGTIGFVGLAVPHVVRLVWGSDHRMLLGSSLRVGASLLIMADLGARTLAAPSEVPIGVLTALTGAPLLLWLLQREQQRGRA